MTFMFDRAVRFSGTFNVTSNVALRDGFFFRKETSQLPFIYLVLRYHTSSQHGNALLASVASNWVVAKYLFVCVSWDAIALETDLLTWYHHAHPCRRTCRSRSSRHSGCPQSQCPAARQTLVQATSQMWGLLVPWHCRIVYQWLSNLDRFSNENHATDGELAYLYSLPTMMLALLIVRSLEFSTTTEVSFAMLRLVIYALLVTRNRAQWRYSTWFWLCPCMQMSPD